MSVSRTSMSQAPRAPSAPDRSVLGRGLLILEALSRSDAPQSLTQVVRSTGIPKSTVHRLLGQLVDQSLVARHEEGFALGIRISEWGARSSCARDLQEICRPHLHHLHRYLGETVHLGVLDSDDVIIIDQLDASARRTGPIRAGSRVPARASALGKALLAFTPNTASASGHLSSEVRDVRLKRYAADHQEFITGISCVAAPIMGRRGDAIGALAVSMPSPRLHARAMGALLTRVACDIQRDIATSGAQGAAGACPAG